MRSSWRTGRRPDTAELSVALHAPLDDVDTVSGLASDPDLERLIDGV